MIGWGNNTRRGGQTMFHRIRMWAQMFRTAPIIAATLVITVPCRRLAHANWNSLQI